MALDTNIALGIKPVEQPNMLAQMGQMMQLRQMQQGFESENALRDFYAQGGDISSAEGKRQLMSKVGLKGMDIIGKQSEISARDIGTAEKSLAMMKNQAGLVRTPQDAANWLTSFYKNPLTRSYVESIAPLDQALAAIPNDPAALQGWLRNASLKADQIFESADAQLGARSRIQAAGIGAAPGMLNAQLAREKYTDQLNFGGDIVTTTMPDPETGQPIEVQARRDLRTGRLIPLEIQAPPMRVDISPSSATSSYQTGGEARNDLATQVAPQGGAAPAANVNALNPNAPVFARPKQVVRQPVAVIKDGVVTLVPPDQAVGMTPATPGAEKALEKAVIAKEGKQAVNGVLNTLYSEYNSLVKSGGITDTRKSVEDNIAARTGASGVGHLTGSFTGSESQSFRDTIEQTRPLLLTAIMKATGLSATQLNSNVELQTYLKTATDPKVSIQSNVKALNNISTMFGLGEKFEVPEIKGSTPKETKPSDAPPAGLSPEIAKLWQYMTPEDRKLWQK